MKIQTGRIRRLYDKALQNNIISANMLLMAVSALNNEICYNDKLTDKQVAVYQSYRNIIAKTAIDNGISKDRITEVMQTLSPERYPSPKQITHLITVIKNRSYSYQAEYIPDSDMQYKTDSELQDQQQTVIKRNQAQIEHEKQFNDICDYISKQFNISPITADMQMKLQQITASNDVILQAFQWYSNDIHNAISGKLFKNSFDKFSYIIGVIKKKIPETITKIERDKEYKEAFWNGNATAIVDGDETLESMIEIQCDKYPDSRYYGMHDYVREQLIQAIERVKSSDYKIVDDYNRIIARSNEPIAEYQRKTTDYYDPKLEELW